MANPYVAGPVPIYIGLYNIGPVFTPIVAPGGATINSPTVLLFLGHTENGLDIQYDHRYTPFRVDLGGDVEADSCYQGSTAIITGTLSRWDDTVYQLMNPPVAQTFGFDPPGNIGTLMTEEGQCIQLVLPFPYQGKPAYATQVVGMRFFSCTLTQDNWKNLGTRPRLLSLSWKANRVFLPGVANPLGYGQWQLFDNTITGIPPGS